MRVIWNGPIQVENFQNLTQLVVAHCGKLRYIFTVTMAQNLPQLSALQIDSCVELEQIIDKDQTSSQDHLQPICFPNLTYINIWKCGSLKCVFPVTVIHGGLPRLKELNLGDLSKLEEVFEGEDSNDEEEVIRLPQFNHLKLIGLPNCASLSPVGYHFVSPSLKEIRVGGCPNITTSFSVDSKQSVHAKTQRSQSVDKIRVDESASQTVDEITVEESASAQETTWPLGSDIEWQKREGR
ncbi:hypothetical protein V6N13_133764 [Hibiscus sabdariffa]